ncbi:hypothetical protein QBC41DRAFT_306889 [Cercophora samala]|uniref:Uncharacterized protein n=1 Tax=Cercophora samala TaxID=330535 RepID=A0AA39Z403_9PEZI|nr:hypothetical protein QBC41DRAFT_306889 [Cercophora samala]
MTTSTEVKHLQEPPIITNQEDHTSSNEVVALLGALKEQGRAPESGAVAARNAGPTLVAAAAAEEEDHRAQPWHSLMAEIEQESIRNPPGSDWFSCGLGFHAHSLAG